MAIALMTLSIMANLALWVVAWRGIPGGQHMLTGLCAAFLSVFAHCMGMFYFIGTGRVIREAARDHGLGEGYARESLAFKIRYFPVASFTIAATMAAPILGGAAGAGRLPGLAHIACAFSAIALNALAAALFCRLAWRNLGLIARLESELAAGAQAAEGAQSRRSAAPPTS